MSGLDDISGSGWYTLSRLSQTIPRSTPLHYLVTDHSKFDWRCFLSPPYITTRKKAWGHTTSLIQNTPDPRCFNVRWCITIYLLYFATETLPQRQQNFSHVHWWYPFGDGTKTMFILRSPNRSVTCSADCFRLAATWVFCWPNDNYKIAVCER